MLLSCRPFKAAHSHYLPTQKSPRNDIPVYEKGMQGESLQEKGKFLRIIDGLLTCWQRVTNSWI